MDAHENAIEIAVISERITELAGNYKALQKNYQVLNDCHTNLEHNFTVMQTAWSTTKNLITWVAGGSLISLIVGVLSLFKLFGYLG